MKLPDVRGRYTENADLSKTNWFRVGGAAKILFKPADIQDLCHFLKNKSADIIVTTLGVGSNIIIRDGGIDGVVVKLGREFSHSNVILSASERSFACAQDDVLIEAGAAALDVNTAFFAAENNIAGLEFLVGIPGTIGGAVAMNAGAYGCEIKDVLVAVELVDMQGGVHKFSNEELQFTYRRCGRLYEQQYIVTKAWLQGQAGIAAEIHARMAQIKSQREESQPIRSRTGGSTFKNPASTTSPLSGGIEGGALKAWQLIDKAGCRGLRIGGAQVSEKHCNFFINTGTATAADLENLIREVQARVLADSGIKLETEIKIIGKP